MNRALKFGVMGLLLFTHQALAFEGDYVWDERFQASLAKARSGQAKDQYAVGEMYFHGRGTKTNPPEALHWFLLAAEQGHNKAAYKAGYLYLHGAGINPRPKKAFTWLEKAAMSGYAPAQYELGRLYASDAAGYFDGAQALKWLGKAKAAGYAPAEAAFSSTVRRLVQGGKRGPATTAETRPRLTQARRQSRQLRPTVVDRPNPKRIILHSQWDDEDGPSTLLPSILTDCRERGNGIECLSSELSMQLSSTRVIYRTRTRITDINADGQFQLVYANKVLSALSAEEGSGEAASRDATRDTKGAVVKMGWQRNERVLDCALVTGRTISCAHGTTRQYRFVGH